MARREVGISSLHLSLNDGHPVQLGLSRRVLLLKRSPSTTGRTNLRALEQVPSSLQWALLI